MDDEPFNRAITALMRQNGVTRTDAASQVLEFLGEVDERMQRGENVLKLFVERFHVSDDYLLDLLFN